MGEAPAGGSWGSGLLLSRAALPGQSPCQGSLWHQRFPLLPIPVDVLALQGAGISPPLGVGCSLGAPQAVLQCSPWVLPCRLLGIFGGKGNLAWGRGRQGAAVKAGAGPAALCQGSSASFGSWQTKQQLGMAFFCLGLSLISHFLVGALLLVTGFPPFFLSSNIIFPPLSLALLLSAPRFPLSSISH